MGDERKQQKEQKQQSIRAARDWLAEADASLTSGSGLKGDLKVMLAQAELQRAQEAGPTSKWTRARRWAWRIVPLTAAAVVVALAWFLTPAVAPPETAIIPSRPAEITTPAQSGERTTEEAAPQESAATTETSALAHEDSTTQAAVASAENITDATSDARAGAIAPVMEASSSDANVSAAPQVAAAQPSAPAVPAPETQKLMQSAGKALRQP